MISIYTALIVMGSLSVFSVLFLLDELCKESEFDYE